MLVEDAIVKRKSVRAFLDKEVSAETLHRILTLAGQAPSGSNTQPWQVAVVKGKTRQKVVDALMGAFQSGTPTSKDFQYYPTEWIEPYKTRRYVCGKALYDALQIQREDKETRRLQWAKNYAGFDAPVMLFFFLDRVMQAGSYMDYGMYLQTLMLAAVGEGLATCPQAALAEYPHPVRKILGYSDQYQLLCGMSLGYEDTQAPVNGYRTERESLQSYVRTFE
jgi:nitroreductase